MVIQSTGRTSVWIWISTFLFLAGLVLSTYVSFLAEFRNCLGGGHGRGEVPSEPLNEPASMVDPMESINNDDLRIERPQQATEAILG